MLNTNEFKGRFGFGAMRLPMKGAEPDFELCNQMFDRFLEAGLNYFDTAHVYLGGKSEVALRESLVKRHPRECIRCGKCERECPQDLPIRQLLTEVAAEFELGLSRNVG